MRASCAQLPQRGFTYLFVLFLVALTSAALAALGQAWSQAAQRERERELQFRGEAIAAAIASYQKASPNRQADLPATLDELLEDRRGPRVLHHLRQRYADPFTGQADWVLVSPVPELPRFNAVRSRSEQPLLRERSPQGQAIAKASDWLFSAPPPEGAASAALPASGAAP